MPWPFHFFFLFLQESWQSAAKTEKLCAFLFRRRFLQTVQSKLTVVKILLFLTTGYIGLHEIMCSLRAERQRDRGERFPNGSAQLCDASSAGDRLRGRVARRSGNNSANKCGFR